MNARKQENDAIFEKNANVAGRGKNVLRVTTLRPISRF